MLDWIRNMFATGAGSNGRARKEDAPGGHVPSERATGERRMPLPYEVQASTRSDVGCHRDVNEDCVRYVTLDAPSGGEDAVLVVADGMGGHAAGEVASAMAVDVVCEAYAAHARTDPHAALEEALRAANRAVHRAAKADASRAGMGTTCTVLVVRDDRAYCAHVGDSRLYLVRDAALYVMSEDHSLVQEMVKNGVLTQEEARHHDDKNVILRALGLRPDVEVATWARPLAVRPGDRFLVCSDGLYDLVGDEQILEIVLGDGLEEAGRRLVALARRNGGYDNITVGLLALRAGQGGPPGAARLTRDDAVGP